MARRKVAADLGCEPRSSAHRTRPGRRDGRIRDPERSSILEASRRGSFPEAWRRADRSSDDAPSRRRSRHRYCRTGSAGASHRRVEARRIPSPRIATAWAFHCRDRCTGNRWAATRRSRPSLRRYPKPGRGNPKDGFATAALPSAHRPGTGLNRRPIRRTRHREAL